ncbi:MAG TPA: phenylalanine--tRNA ligase subunit alpha, partial [Methanoregulaceae archaeon]|nr:phenylalanine--tRNA ligase subunit alpha [Methanoregulaceae archaeon]
MELTLNEKRLLLALGPLKSADPSALAGIMDTTEESVIQYAHLCSDRGLVRIEKHVSVSYHFT